MGSAEQFSINELHELLQLLLAIRHFYQQHKLEVPGEWKQLEESIQKMRKEHLLKSNILDQQKILPEIKKVHKWLKNQGPKENGIDRKNPEPDQQNGEEKSEAVKRKKKSNKKEKKLKNLKRMELASQGFSDEFKF